MICYCYNFLGKMVSFLCIKITGLILDECYLDVLFMMEF